MAKYTGLPDALPNIDTVWVDKKSHPYAAMILYAIASTYRLYLSTSPFTHIVDGSSSFIVGSDFLTYDCKSNPDNEEMYGDEWVAATSPSDNRFAVYSSSAVWTSHDILNEDGSVYLAASDPVPALSLTDSDLYRNVNGKLVGHTLYKKVGGELVALDNHIMA